MSAMTDVSNVRSDNYTYLHEPAYCSASRTASYQHFHCFLSVASQAMETQYCPSCDPTRSNSMLPRASLAPRESNPTPLLGRQYQDHHASPALHHGWETSTYTDPRCSAIQSPRLPPSTCGWKAREARLLRGPHTTAEAHWWPNHTPPLHPAQLHFPRNPIQEPALRQPLGPPEKPIQSRFAVWVGNLPLHADLLALKDYFSHHAIREIVSIKYIRKSSCAFVNYRSREACLRTIQRLDRQYFFGNKLICRARTYTEDGKAIRPGHAANTIRSAPTEAIPTGGVTREEISEDTSRSAFFILKSLTVADLEASVREGTWTPQAHNQNTMDEAYRTSGGGDVWLIFSVNQSHEFFGAARMISDSGFVDTGRDAVDHIPGSTSVGSEPCYLQVPASRWAPPGIIFEDKLRDVFWWEATMQDDGSDQDSEPDTPIRGRWSMHQSKGTKPFKVQWVSLHRVPFRRVRGMVNGLNDDRPVQMARDGTPLAADAGQRLLSLFGIPDTQRSPPIGTTQAMSSTSTPCEISAAWTEDAFVHSDPSTTPTAASFSTSARSSSGRSSMGTIPSLTACSSFSADYSAVDSPKAPSLAGSIDEDEPLQPALVVNGSMGRRRKLSL